MAHVTPAFNENKNAVLTRMTRLLTASLLRNCLEIQIWYKQIQGSVLQQLK